MLRKLGQVFGLYLDSSEPEARVVTGWNEHLKRFDGATAAERLFNRKFTDPFEVIVNKMGDLPLPRTSNTLIDVTSCF